MAFSAAPPTYEWEQTPVWQERSLILEQGGKIMSKTFNAAGPHKRLLGTARGPGDRVGRLSGKTGHLVFIFT